MMTGIKQIVVLGSSLAILFPACAAQGGPRVLRPAAHLAVPRASHTTTALADGSLLVIGGFRKGPDGHSQLYADTTERIDPVAGAIVAGPRLRHARAGHAAVRLADGRLLVAGGWSDSGMLRSAEVLDAAGVGFTTVGDLAEPRGGFAAVALADGRVLVCGGGDGAATRSAEIFDPADDRFHPTGDMIAPRLGHSATLLADGRVLLVGGASGRDRLLASAEIYDPRSGTFAPAGPLAIERYKHAAIRLRDGRVLIIGGSSLRDWTGTYDTTEIYDPTTDRFRAGPKLTTPRFKLMQAVALVGDDVAVAGGASTVELVRPDRGSRVIARLGQSLYYDTLTVVGDRLVVVGGYDARVRTATAVWFVPGASSGARHSRP